MFWGCICERNTSTHEGDEVSLSPMCLTVLCPSSLGLWCHVVSLVSCMSATPMAYAVFMCEMF